MPYFGIEEEVFITEPVQPTTRSLYYLAKLLWKDPRFYYTHTASNFTRGRDTFRGIMSGIEVSTGIHKSIEGLLAEFIFLRRQLADVCSGLIVPLGHLFDDKTTTRMCALHVHISEVEHPEKTYADLVYFLPVLSLAMTNSPAAGNKYFGKSYRMAKSFAVGPLTGNPYDRMQDIIFAKRLNTIEIRVFDPVPDIKRLSEVLLAIRAIVQAKPGKKLDIDRYNRLRANVATTGLNDEIFALYDELFKIYPLPNHLIERTVSDESWQLFSQKGLVEAYEELDLRYRSGAGKPEIMDGKTADIYYSAAGFLGYYLPKMPYVLWKYLKES